MRSVCNLVIVRDVFFLKIFSINHSNIEIGGERANYLKDFGLDIHCYL